MVAPRHRRRLCASAVAVMAALLLAGCGGHEPAPEVAEGDPSATPSITPSTAPPREGTAEAEPSLAPEGPDANTAGTAEVAERSEQRARRGEQTVTRGVLEIPAIGVSTRLVSLGLNADRSMQVPNDFSAAGWYRHSPMPGEPGPAVIAGHVDSRSGPAVFYRLAELSAGDAVRVRYPGGTSAVFTVDGIEQHPKDAFPTERVYGDTAGPELRLITCGGVFDRSAAAHRDNVIVYASLAS